MVFNKVVSSWKLNTFESFDKTGGTLVGKFNVNTIENNNNQNPNIIRNGLRLTIKINNNHT